MTPTTIIIINTHFKHKEKKIGHIFILCFSHCVLILNSLHQLSFLKNKR